MPPTSREVKLNNIPFNSWPHKKLARHLSLFPQSPSAPEAISAQQLFDHGRYPYQGLLSASTDEDIQVIDWALNL